MTDEYKPKDNRGKGIDYDFETETPTTYKCTLSMPFKNRLMHIIYNKSKSKLKKKGVNPTGNINQVKEFEAEPRYFKLIHTIIFKKFKDIIKEVKEDGIEVLTSEVTACIYQRKTARNWTATITVSGNFADKRGK